MSLPKAHRLVRPGRSSSALSELLGEYQSLLHIATSYGISEPPASRILHLVEDCLIQSNLFNLPKSLFDGKGIDGNVVINETTAPMQRPKNRKKLQR